MHHCLGNQAAALLTNPPPPADLPTRPHTSHSSSVILWNFGGKLPSGEMPETTIPSGSLRESGVNSPHRGVE